MDIKCRSVGFPTCVVDKRVVGYDRVVPRRVINSSRHHTESHIPEIVDLMLHSIQVDARARFSVLVFLVLQYSLHISVTRIVLLGIRDT